jgi:ribonuclease HI
MLSNTTIELYTDGSCHTQKRIGAWVALLIMGEERLILKGLEKDTTHNRMEVLAVLKAFEFLITEKIDFASLRVYSDSQYVVEICERKEKLKQKNYLTKEGSSIQNADLIKSLVDVIESYPVTFVKVKAHQKKSDSVNYNREVDKLVRAHLRQAIDHE